MTSYKIDVSSLINKSDFNFRLMSSADLDESLNVLKKSFFPLESVHRALKASENPKAIEEVSMFCKKTFEDGISVLAEERSTGKIVSVAFNKIQTKPAPGQPGAFDAIAATFTQPESKAVLDYMTEIDSKVDLFGRYKTTVLFELMFLGTLPEYTGRHLAQDVCQVCLQVASQTQAKAVTMLCTSPWTFRIANNLGFEELYRGTWDAHEYNGVNYTEILGTEAFYTLAAYPL